MANALEAASLVMIPSGYEDGTLGSLKPTDGSGDFTFSRGSNLSATRINEQGYIEKGYENLLLQSNTFSDAAWLQTSCSVASGQSGYDGSSDAWLLSKSDANGRVRQYMTSTGVRTASIYAKEGTTSWLRITYGGKTTYFDLGNGVLGSVNAIDSTITSVGNGFYRCTLTANAASADYVNIYPADSDGVTSGTSGSIYIQDAMLNQGLVAYPYIETTTAPVAGGILEDMPRLDWSGSCPSLLLEPSRTNELANSEYFEAGTLSNATLSLSGTSLENVTNAYALTENTANAEHYWISEQMTTATNNNLVSTIFVKPNGRTKIKLWNYHLDNQMSLVDIDLTTNTTSNGGGTNVTFVSANVTDYSNGWKRVEIQSIKSSSTYPYRIRVNLLDDNGSDVYTGDGTSGVLIYGAQMEQDATYPTSYIPTYGVSQTRLADNIDIPSSADLSIPSDSWTILYDISDDSIIPAGPRWVADSLNNMNLYPVAPNKTRFYWRGIGQYIALGGGSKVIARYDGTTATEFHDGVNKGSASYSGQLPFDFKNEFQSNSGKYFLNKIVIFPTALSDSECIALTTI